MGIYILIGVAVLLYFIIGMLIFDDFLEETILKQKSAFTRIILFIIFHIFWLPMTIIAAIVMWMLKCYSLISGRKLL